MSELSEAHAMATERSCALTAIALSDRRRTGAHLVSGQHRGFGLSSMLDIVHVPYPPVRYREWTRRTLTCGVALQCSPSKDRLTDYRLNELSGRELSALALVEAGVALGVGRRELAGGCSPPRCGASSPPTSRWHLPIWTPKRC